MHYSREPAENEKYPFKRISSPISYAKATYLLCGSVLESDTFPQILSTITWHELGKIFQKGLFKI